jgi:predicted dehydrogenase
VAPPKGRCLDVDVVVDLMIHDLDLVLGWAAGSEVAWVDAEGDCDTATVRLRTTSGISASLVASRVAEHTRRQIRCGGADGVTVLDMHAGRAWREGVELPRDPRDALGCQWERFLAAVERNEDLPDTGVRAVALAERIRGALRPPAQPVVGAL